MDENKVNLQEEEIEYEDVKHLPVSAFLAIGLAFGIAAGFSAGNLLFDGHFAFGMGFFVCVGLVGGLIVGLINKKKSNKKA